MPPYVLRWPRALGLLLGYAADLALGDPDRFHPVAGFGRTARTVEERTYRDRRAAGLGHAAILVGAATSCGAVAAGLTRDRAAAEVAVTATATWIVLGGRSLQREASAVHGHLDRADLEAARSQVTHLVGRDPALLDNEGIARATVESVAENTSDAVVAPLLWGAVAGPAGLIGYRAANTLDAMVGHRSSRYAEFGWAAAQLDDLLNLVPARICALLTAAAASAAGGSARRSLTAWRLDASGHPSPNAGPVEAAFAGALGITLGGANAYDGAVEDRGTLGHGRSARASDIPQAVLLAGLVGAAAVVTAATAATARPRRLR